MLLSLKKKMKMNFPLFCISKLLLIKGFEFAATRLPGISNSKKKNSPSKNDMTCKIFIRLKFNNNRL